MTTATKTTTTTTTTPSTKAMPLFAKKADGSGITVRTSIRAGSGNAKEQACK